MSDDKKQHYVPQCYLRSWTTDNYLYSVPKNRGLTRKQKTKEVAKKNHLYTLPSDFFKNSIVKSRDLREMISEKLIFKVWEDKWKQVTDLFNHHFNLTQVLHTIKGFVITQSFRTPKFIRSNQEILERMGKLEDSFDNTYQYVFLGTNGLTDYIKNCVCEMVKIMDIPNFITCDNPATHWIQEGEMYHYLNGIALRTDLYKNPNYKILCPLHPKYFAVLTPNLGVEIKDKIKNKVWFKPVNINDINQLNQMVEYGADKMLFAKDVKDFIKQ